MYSTMKTEEHPFFSFSLSVDTTKTNSFLYEKFRKYFSERINLLLIAELKKYVYSQIKFCITSLKEVNKT